MGDTQPGTRGHRQHAARHTWAQATRSQAHVGTGESPTLEEALHPEVADTETQNGKLVQLRHDVWRKRQQAGQVVQLGVETVPVPLRRV